ncbi:MAG: ACP S-malonyltransferase [Pseudomonadota bacterium]
MAKIAWMFPGQGAQSVGMLKDLHALYPQLKQTFDEASDVLHTDLWSLTQQGPESQLNSSAWTQPALLTAGIAVFRLWCEQERPLPCVVLGHSLGEYTALVAAGALSFSEAVHLVHLRGTYMQSAVPEGSGLMAAILGLSDEDVTKACHSVDGSVSPANFNTPGQVVIAGTREAVELAIQAAKALGAKRALPLAVSVPSHCALMQPAAEQFQAALEAVQWQAPRIPVIHNVDACVHPNTFEMIEVLSQQLVQPVQWVKCVQALSGFGVTQAFESGPSAVLTGLVKRIDANIPCTSLEAPAAWQAV